MTILITTLILTRFWICSHCYESYLGDIYERYFENLSDETCGYKQIPQLLDQILTLLKYERSRKNRENGTL